MLARKQLFVTSCINQLGSSYLSFKKLILLSVLGQYIITGCSQHFTIYCSPVTPPSDHTKHLKYFTEHDVHPSNTLAKPQIPLAKNYSTPLNGATHRLPKNIEQSITTNSYVTIEINGTELSKIPLNRDQTFDHSQETLASSESRPSVVVSHIMVDEDDPLPPVSVLMSDTMNGTNRGVFGSIEDESSIGGPERKLADVKNFMKLMRNSTSQWLGRSQALGITTSRRPVLSPKSRKFLQDIKSKRKLSSPPSSMTNQTSAKSISTANTTQSPSNTVPGPIQSSLTEGASSKHENWVDYDNRVDHEVSSSRPNEEMDEPLEESASTDSKWKAPSRVSIAQQQNSKISRTSEEEEDEGKPVVSESTTTTIEDDQGKKTVFRHAPGTSINGSGGDNKLPAKLREKIIEQFLKNGGDPQNIVVSDSTITTTSQSKKKTITTVYKIVPIESPVPARDVKSNGWKGSQVQSKHEDDDHEDGQHLRPPKSPISRKYQGHGGGGGSGGKKLKKIMVTRIEVPHKEHVLEHHIKPHEHDDSLGEFYSGPHETIFGHMRDKDKAKDHSRVLHDSDLRPHSGWPEEENNDGSTYMLNEINQKSNDNSRSRAKAHKRAKNRNSQTIDESAGNGADDDPNGSTSIDDGHQREAGKKAPRTTLQVMTLKKSPSTPDLANASRDTEEENQSTPGEAVGEWDAISSQEPEGGEPMKRGQSKGKPKSGRARASREDLVPTLPPKGKNEPADTDDDIEPLYQNSATTRRPTVASSRRPAVDSGLSILQQSNSNSTSFTTKRPNNRKTKESAQEQRDTPSASVASARSNSGQKRDSGGPARSSSGRRGQAATTSTTSTTTSTTTTTTTSTTTTTTPRPRPRSTTRAASTRRPSQASSAASRAPTTTTDAPESLGEDQPTVVTSQLDNPQSSPPTPSERQSNGRGAKAALKSLASTSRSQPKFQPTMIPRANATVAPVGEPSATAPMNGANQQERPQQQQQEQRPTSRARNIMMLIDFDPPPPSATSNENFNDVARQTFNQQLPIDISDVARKFRSESQQYEMPFLSTRDADNQWRPLSIPYQWRPPQVSTPATETNNSNARQQAPTVSVQIYNNLARDQQQQQRQPQQETPLEQSTISPSDADFINQMAVNAQPSHSRQQQRQRPLSPIQFALAPSTSSSTSNSDPFEDFAAATPRARGMNGRQFQLNDPDNSSLFSSQHYQPTQQDRASPFLFASSSQVGGKHQAGRSTSGMQQVVQYAHSPPQQQHGDLSVLPDESAQTNRLLMKVIDEIAKSALASGYQVADNQQQQRRQQAMAYHNYLTPSGGDVSATPAESHDVNQVGESDSDEDSEEDEQTSAGSMQYPFNLAATAGLMTGNRFPSSGRPAALGLADLLIMNHAISGGRHRSTTTTTNPGI